MTPDALADLHALAMVHGTPWSAKSFAAALDGHGTILVAEGASSWPKYRRGGTGGQAAPPPIAMPKAAQKIGFALGRVIADEAELLTLAVDPAIQRQGLGRALLTRFEQAVSARGAASAVLEVAETNESAKNLYNSMGWVQVGLRERYYRPGQDRPVGALILRKVLA